MIFNYISQAIVQSFAMFVQHHGVCIAVEFFKAQTAIVFLLDLLDRSLETIPYAVHISLVHSRLPKSNPISIDQQTVQEKL